MWIVAETVNRRTLLVGLGSPHGDDQIGWLVADAVAELDPTMLAVRALSPMDLLDRLDGVDRLAICDACVGSGAVGALTRWDWPTIEALPTTATGTHDMSLVEVLELAESLGRLPGHVTIWGIEAEPPHPAAPVSAKLAAAIPHLAQAICLSLAPQP